MMKSDRQPSGHSQGAEGQRRSCQTALPRMGEVTADDGTVLPIAATFPVRLR